jgi:hypothetical protein
VQLEHTRARRQRRVRQVLERRQGVGLLPLLWVDSLVHEDGATGFPSDFAISRYTPRNTYR